jgi:hypothetical protein
VHPFDDRTVALEALTERVGGAGRGGTEDDAEHPDGAAG